MPPPLLNQSLNLKKQNVSHSNLFKSIVAKSLCFHHLWIAKIYNPMIDYKNLPLLIFFGRPLLYDPAHKHYVHLKQLLNLIQAKDDYSLKKQCFYFKYNKYFFCHCLNTFLKDLTNFNLPRVRHSGKVHWNVK